MYDADVPSVLDRLQKIKNCTLLLSNPCIELWFLLHFKNQTSLVDCAYCSKELSNRNKSYDKGKCSEKLRKELIDKSTKAGKRAEKLGEFLNPCNDL